jgi:cytidylate kinase
LYRALALGCLRKEIDVKDEGACLEFAKKACIEYRENQVYLEGENIDAFLHTDEVDRYTPPLSSIAPIRVIVNDIIRKIAERIDIIVEGRDMTSVVFPDAEHRFYLDASIEERARRRFEQGTSNLSLEKIKEAIIKRDEIDKNKRQGGLKIAAGAQFFDTSLLTIEQTYDKLIEKIKIKG